LAVLSLLGTAVFAASGAHVAAEQRFDLIGAVFLSVAAGLGGGTLVDLLIGGRCAGYRRPNRFGQPCCRAWWSSKRCASGRRRIRRWCGRTRSVWRSSPR